MKVIIHLILESTHYSLLVWRKPSDDVASASRASESVSGSTRRRGAWLRLRCATPPPAPVPGVLLPQTARALLLSPAPDDVTAQNDVILAQNDVST
jgi:hypothetical protein